MRVRSVQRGLISDQTIEFLQCHIYKHAWYDEDMLPMIWGRQKVEHWKLRCERCRGTATEYRDSVTCARIGQRQYQQAPGYLLGVNYCQTDFLLELRNRRLKEKRDQKNARRRASRAAAKSS